MQILQQAQLARISIDISAIYDSFADLKANAYQFGNDVAIGLGHNDQLVVRTDSSYDL